MNNYPWEVWEGVSLQTVASEKELLKCVQIHEDGSRFGLAYIRKDGIGHVIVAEKKDGELKLYDPQTGKNVNGIDFDSMTDVKLWRTDNKDISDRGRTACEGR